MYDTQSLVKARGDYRRVTLNNQGRFATLNAVIFACDDDVSVGTVFMLITQKQMFHPKY